LRAGLNMLPAAVSEVEQPDDAHVGEAATLLLARRLGIGRLVLGRVHELDGTAVDGLEVESVPCVPSGDAGAEVAADPAVYVLEEVHVHPPPRLAVARCVRGRNRKPAGRRPALDVPDSFLAGGVGFEDLCEPCPEDGQMAEAALARCGVDGGEEIRRQDIGEKDGITAEGTACDDGRSVADSGLQSAPCGGKNGERKVGQERLFFHTFKPYADRLSV